jgi:hypothetical protein
LARSYYHRFGSLKKVLHGRQFRRDEEVQQAVHTWLCDQPKAFLSDGIKKLVERCKKCVDKQGDCVEKCHNYVIGTYIFLVKIICL